MKLNFSNILKQSSSEKYHQELISLFNQDMLISASVGNIILPSIVFLILQDLIPSSLLLGWLIFSIFIGVVRIYISKIVSLYQIKKFFIHTYILSAVSGLLWSCMGAIVSFYADVNYLFMMAIIILGLVGGANTTLTPIYKAYLFFSLSALIPFIVVLFRREEVEFFYTGILAIIFMIFVLVGGYKHYAKLFEAITLKDKLKQVNLHLESEVKKRTQELEELNGSLEEKVEDEIAKNRMKDQQLLQQSRMAQMGEMISMIAHQWRQPLGAISASSIDMKMKIALGHFDLQDATGQEDCQNYFDAGLSRTQEYVQNLTQTIDDFRNFYKPNKESHVVDIHLPIKKSLDIIAPLAKSKNIEILQDTKATKEIEVYENELMQVFLNIVKNAQDQLIEKKVKEPKITIATENTSDGVLIEISDNGGGVAPDILTKIFDPYFSTKDEKNGTGLGLYMSKTIIEEHHHGLLSVSNNREGACFKITLKDRM